MKRPRARARSYPGSPGARARGVRYRSYRGSANLPPARRHAPSRRGPAPNSAPRRRTECIRPETMESIASPRRFSSSKVNFAGGVGITGGAQRPLPVVEIQRGLHRAQIHVRVVIGVDGSHVAPVSRRHPADRRECGWSGNRRRTSRHLPDQFGQNIAAEIVRAGLVGGVLVQLAQQRSASRKRSCPWRRRHAPDRPE